jgi:hypothetical protein
MNTSRSISNSKKNPKRLALSLISSPVTSNNTSSTCNNQEPTIIMQSPIYYQEGPACILSNLYLGAHYNARNIAQLSRHQISCVINVASEITIMKPKQIQYHHLHWTHSQNNLARSEFGRAIEMIEAAHYQNQTVLVHCQQGIERSAALVLAFLMRSSYRMKKITTTSTANHLAGQNWTLDQALAFVQEKAPGIRPNMEILYQLREYEKQLLEACPQRQYQQPQQHSLQTRTRRSGSVGCHKPTTTVITASSSLRTCTLLGRQQRPRSASVRETSMSASVISTNNNESSVAKLKMQVVPVLQQEKSSRNKLALVLVCILVLVAAALYQRKLKVYYHNIKINRLLTITTYDDINNDNLTMKNNNDSSHLTYISFLFKYVYPIF